MYLTSHGERKEKKGSAVVPLIRALVRRMSRKRRRESVDKAKVQEGVVREATAAKDSYFFEVLEKVRERIYDVSDLHLSYVFQLSET
jgi:hypothetical protein